MSFRPGPFPKFPMKILRNCEDELASSLSGVDTQKLCDMLFQRRLLSTESRAHFTSLDHSRLEPQLQVRYLVRLASERVKTDPALGHNLIEVLDTLEGVPSSLTDKLKQAMADTNEGPTDDSDSVGGMSATAVGGASEEKDIVLTREDISLLTKLLSKVSHKWLEIAISLGLQENEQADCKGETNTISLSRSIGFWIANSSKPTLNKLTNSLSSDTVGRKNISEEVEGRILAARFTSCSQNKSPSASESKSSTKSSQTPRIVSQSLPTEVTDGKSTLLQVQARPRESVVSYQWNKDGLPLANGSRYSGVDEDILVVRHASQGTEGEYTCCVSLEDRQVTSDSITLTVQFPPAKNLLLSKYSSLKVVSKNDWPPQVSESYINLALVKSSANKNETDIPVRGDADKIIAEKKKIEYDIVFGEYKSSELILVEGRPGSGKTTLIHKVIKDWASGKALAKSKLTLLLTLRLLNGSQDETLEKVLQTLYSDEDAIAILPDIRDGEGVCFVLDGLDEYQPQNREKSVILKLLDRKYLPKSMIIVFTRPSATEQLNKDLISKTIEVFGFKKEQISEYIEKFPFAEEGGTSDSSITRASQINDYLVNHPNIHDMCYLPIHAAMICFLFRSVENISATQTEVYEKFTVSIIHRHLAARYENCKALDSLNDLDVEKKKHFKDLCHLAYEMTIKSKQVVSAQELQVQLGGSGYLSEEGGLGLLTICPTLHQTSIHQSYAFLHLTFQEFLTAYYIANYMKVSQQLKILEEYSKMETVWLFYSGLADFEKTPKILDKLFSHHRFVSTELCHYALESQTETLSDKMLKKKSSRFFLIYRTPTDLLSIEYVIATSSLPITSICIVGRDHDHNRMRALLQQLQKANIQQLHYLVIGNICDEETNSLCEVLQTATSIATLNLMIKHTRSCCAKEVALQINQCNKLSCLTLSYSGTPECIQTIVSSLSSSTTWLSLSLKELDSQSIQALGNGLQLLHTNHLRLKVTDSDINENGITCLVDVLQNIKSLDLDLSHNNIDSSGITSLTVRLSTLKLTQWKLSRNNIGPDCAPALAGGIKGLAELKELDLSHNNIGPDGAAALAGGIKGLAELKELDLSHNNIGPDGAAALAGGIKGLAELKELDLSHNNIGPDGAAALAGGIKGLAELNKLDLSHNNIGPDGAAALAGGLQYLTELRYCNLSHNNIDVAAAKAVLTSLKKYDQLVQLTFNESDRDDWFNADIVILGLVSPDDTAAISELVEAAQHENKTRTLKLGFKTIKVPPSKNSKCAIM